jgi:hypothetical protein
MNAAELLTLIETAGGELIAHPDGQLTGKRIPVELHEALRALKPEVLILLRERQEQAVTAKPAFIYKPRTENQIERRAHQSYAPDCKAAATAGRKTKKGPHSVCVCGHDLSQHCTEPPMQHWPSSEGAFGFYFCIAEHCEARDCACWAFRSDEAVVPSMKRRKADDWTPCATCGHRKGLHCHASRKPLIPGTYQGFALDGEPFGCKHGPVDGRAYVCTSASCAEIDCACQRFRNPLLRPRKTAKPPKTVPDRVHGGLIPRADLMRAHENYLREKAAQNGPVKTKETLLLETAAEADLTALSVKQIATLTGMSATWVRKTLRAAGLMAPATLRKRTITTTSATGAPPVETENASPEKEII